MSDENQILIPQSFMALFLAPGRHQPNARHEVVAGRYELCEDMACLLSEHAQTMALDQGVAESEVLHCCHQGLLGDASAFTASEAGWVICRLAELLDWPQPALPVAADPGSAP